MPIIFLLLLSISVRLFDLQRILFWSSATPRDHYPCYGKAIKKYGYTFNWCQKNKITNAMSMFGITECKWAYCAGTLKIRSEPHRMNGQFGREKKIGDVFISAPASIVTIALRCAHFGQIELHAHYTCCKLQEGNPCNPNENRKEQKTEIQCSFLVPINLKSNFMHQWSIASSTINYVHLLLLYVGVAFSNDGKSSEVDNRTKIERHIGWK